MKSMASSPITSWQTDGETMETVTDFLYLGSKITVDSDCSHEIKRGWLLGRKAMTNLDSVLKSRDITLPTKLRIVKAMLFPVVRYGCELDHKEGWALKNWCFWTLALEKALQSPLDSRRFNQSILREINPDYSLEWLILKLKFQYFSHMTWRAFSLEKTLILWKTEGRRRRGRQRMR